MMAGKQVRRFSSRAKWLLLLWLLTLPLANPWVRGDGVGYYAYAQALLVQGNLNFQNAWLHANPSFRMGRVDAEGHLKPNQFTANGHVGNHFAVGPSLLWAPFLIVVHGVVLALDHFGWHIPANGYSRPYLVTMALATAFYSFLGLWLSFLLARDFFGERTALVATLGIWFGSSLPVYMYFNPSWAHALAAFAVALFLWYWHRTRSSRTLRQWILLGLIGGLMLDVYYPNGVLILLPLIDALGAYGKLLPEFRRRASELGRLFLVHLAFAAAVVIAYLPTLVTRAILYGTPFTFGAYDHQRWSWTAPALGSVLFSADHGLFVWTPLVALAVVGMALFARRKGYPGAHLLLVFFAFLYLIACYGDWDGISSFGNRFFVSLTPVFVIGLAALLDSVERWSRGRRWVWRTGCALVALLVFWNLGFIFQWGTQLVPARGPVSWRQVAYNQVEVVPRKAAGQLARYFQNRHGMMRKIEQRDLKRLESKPAVSASAPSAVTRN